MKKHAAMMLTMSAIVVMFFASPAFAGAGAVAFQVDEPFVIEDRLFEDGILEIEPVFWGSYVALRLDGRLIAIMDRGRLPKSGPVMLHLERDWAGNLHVTALSGMGRYGERERTKITITHFERDAGVSIGRSLTPLPGRDDAQREVVLTARAASRR